MRRPRAYGLRPSTLLTVFFIAVMSFWIWEARDFATADRYLPWFGASGALAAALVQLGLDVRQGRRRMRTSPGTREENSAVLDIAVDDSIPPGVVARRAASYFGLFVGLLAGIWLIGFSTALVLFLLITLRVWGKLDWLFTIGVPLIILSMAYFFFDGMVGVVWPVSLFEQTTGVSLDLIPRISALRYGY